MSPGPYAQASGRLHTGSGYGIRDTGYGLGLWDYATLTASVLLM